MNVLLEVRNLCYAYSHQDLALDSVSLSISQGQTLAVLGGNGAGKSTLFLNLNGVLLPSAGELLWQGHPVERTPQATQALRKHVGIVFQDPNDQIFSANVADDIAFGLLNLGLPESEVRTRIEAVINQLGISEYAHKPTHALSFGQKKRVALAGVLAMRPEILILDEPTAGLDPAGISEMFKLIDRLKQENGLTVILATHDIDLVALYCDMACLLDHGRVVFSGAVRELIVQAEFLRRHALRLPRIAHLMGILAHQDGLPVDGHAATIAQARRSIVDCVRENSTGKNSIKENSIEDNIRPLSAGTETTIRKAKRLRSGFTTGTCASAAVAAACETLLGGYPVDNIGVTLPEGSTVSFPIEIIEFDGEFARCGVRKDAGDDPDVTHGLVIEATVRRSDDDLVLTAGPGIGIVTRPGLACAVGEPAINPVPRRMILEHAKQICQRHGYEEGLQISIAAPGGEGISRKTFNPRLGIVGGISILGTTGIVEPMSEKALIETIHVLVNQASCSNPETILLTPGNYGRAFCLTELVMDVDAGVKIGNFVGETLDYLVEKDFREVLLVGHIGKLVKIAGGSMNTHSLIADARMEILAAHAALAGADRPIITTIMSCLTTREAIDILLQNHLAKPVFESVAEKVKHHCQMRARQNLTVEVVLFSAEDHLMAQTAGAARLIGKLTSGKWAAEAQPIDLSQGGQE